MVERFYCQLDYAHIPYPNALKPSGNIADNGCGVCCASMLIEGMLSIAFSVADCAIFSKRCGAREGFGTDFYILGGALAGRFGLSMRPSNDIEEVIGFLNTNKLGMVVANVRGDREGYVGVFADSGHYVLLEGAKNRELCVIDPMYQPGRYDKEGRAGKVRMEGYRAYAAAEVLQADCHQRPFFLYWRDENVSDI